MSELTIEKLPEAVANLTKKVDVLCDIIKNVQQHPGPERYLTVGGAADFLSLSVPTIYSKVSRREIPYMKRGKRLYFLREDLENFLRNGRVKTINEMEVEADQYLAGKGNRK